MGIEDMGRASVVDSGFAFGNRLGHPCVKVALRYALRLLAAVFVNEFDFNGLLEKIAKPPHCQPLASIAVSYGTRAGNDLA
jgi:hypothetical protein